MVSFSVITACFNNENSVQSTIKSLNQQTNVTFEHLVIDGGSTDSTLAILKKADLRGVLLSETDQGLYDALNKGLSLAANQVVAFLHADDVLAQNNVLEQIGRYFDDDEVEAVYSDLNYLSGHSDRVVRYWKSGSPGSFKAGWMPPHPALFVRKRVFERVGNFRLDMGSAADYEWMLRAIHVHKIKLNYCPITAINMRLGGMSNKGLASRKEGLKYDLLAWEINGLGKNYWAVFLKKIRKFPQFFRFIPTGKK